MTRVAMLYLCTGKYQVFWPEFYRSFEAHFLPDCEKHNLVFTDAEKLHYANPANVEDNRQNSQIPLWHDESQLNRYIAETDPAHYRLLTPAYWYPEGWDMPFEQKILVRDKNKVLDMAAVKGARREMGFAERKWDAFREKYLPYLWRARDAALGKKVLKQR